MTPMSTVHWPYEYNENRAFSTWSRTRLKCFSEVSSVAVKDLRLKDEDKDEDLKIRFWRILENKDFP